MKKVRIEIHLEPKEVKELDKIAKEEGRSRKNFCETEIKKIINAGLTINKSTLKQQP